MSSIDNSTTKHTGENVNIYAKSAQSISNGICNILEPPLKNARNQLKELELKHKELVQTLHKENLNISEVQYSQELSAMFVKMKLYHAKLQTIKKDMKSIHDRSQKLKKRALKLKELKELEPREEIIVTKPTGIITVNGSMVTPQYLSDEPK